MRVMKLCLFTFALAALSSYAQREHPEHPTGPASSSQTSSPAAGGGTPPAPPGPVSDTMAPDPPGLQGGGEGPAGPVGPPDQGAAPEPPRGPMSPQDARVNLPTVVETYINERSPRGYLPLQDKKTRKVWKLQLERIDEDTVRPAGMDRYKACVKMRTAPNGPDHRLDVDFTVDFSGVQWKVASVAIHSVTGQKPAPKAGRKRRAKTPS